MWWRIYSLNWMMQKRSDLAQWKKSVTDKPLTLLIINSEYWVGIHMPNLVTYPCRCIQGLTKFVQPILDGICATTGWKATFIAGGPEQADNSHLNAIRWVFFIYFCGQDGLIFNSSQVFTQVHRKMTFGCSERAAYKKHILDAYECFLKKCYSAYLLKVDLSFYWFSK